MSTLFALDGPGVTLGEIMINFPHIRNVGVLICENFAQWAEKNHGIPLEVLSVLFRKGEKIKKYGTCKNDLLEIAKGLFKIKG